MYSKNAVVCTKQCTVYTTAHWYLDVTGRCFVLYGNRTTFWLNMQVEKFRISFTRFGVFFVLLVLLVIKCHLLYSILLSFCILLLHVHVNNIHWFACINNMCMYLVTTFVNIRLFSYLHSYRSLIVLHSSTSPMRDLFHTENVIFLMRYLFSSYIVRWICMPVVCHYREFSHRVYTSVMFFINIQQCMLLAITILQYCKKCNTV